MGTAAGFTAPSPCPPWRRRLRQKRDLGHEPRGIVGDEERRGLGSGIEHRPHPIHLLGRKVLQDVVQHQLLGAGMADADAHPPEIVAEERIDRADAVMPGRAAAALHPDLALGEIELVVEHRHLAGLDLVEPRRGRNQLADCRS